MVEKEIKEWANKMYPSDGQAQRYLLMGATFGYNKANEWHSYAERPKEKLNALCFDIRQNRFILGYYDIESDEWIKYGGYEIITIDLWKKIVPPELPKESE